MSGGIELADDERKTLFKMPLNFLAGSRLGSFSVFLQVGSPVVENRYSRGGSRLPFSGAKHTSFVTRSRIPFYRVEIFDKCDMSEGHRYG
jgi:hypothetical protein